MWCYLRSLTSFPPVESIHRAEYAHFHGHKIDLRDLKIQERRFPVYPHWPMIHSDTKKHLRGEARFDICASS